MFGNKPEPKPVAKADKPFELMSFDELLAIKARLDQELASRGPGELEALKEKLSLMATAQGISVADLIGVGPRSVKKERKKREAKIKYRNPDNQDETWTGIGKPKKWLQDKLDAGATLRDFAIA